MLVGAVLSSSSRLLPANTSMYSDLPASQFSSARGGGSRLYSRRREAALPSRLPNNSSVQFIISFLATCVATANARAAPPAASASRGRSTPGSPLVRSAAPN